MFIAHAKVVTHLVKYGIADCLFDCVRIIALSHDDRSGKDNNFIRECCDIVCAFCFGDTLIQAKISDRSRLVSEVDATIKKVLFF